MRLSLISPGSNIESHSEMKMKDTSLNETYFNFKVKTDFVRLNRSGDRKFFTYSGGEACLVLAVMF